MGHIRTFSSAGFPTTSGWASWRELLGDDDTKPLSTEGDHGASYGKDWSGREDLNLRPPGPEFRVPEPISLLLNHLSGASTV
jgi:hypothetical protein